MLSFFREILRRAGLPGAAAQNLGWLITERLMRLVLNVGVGFLVARYLGPSQFGLYSYAFALVGIALAVAEAGVDGVVKRELVRAPERGASVLAAAGRLRLLLGGVCFLAVLGWAAFGETDPVARRLLAVLALLLFQPALAVTDLWLQARLQARLAVWAQLPALVIGAAARIALVLTAAPLVAFALVAASEGALAVFLLRRAARHAGAPSAPRGGAVPVATLWADAWPLLFSALTVLVYQRIDVIMLRQMAGEAEAGTYAAAGRLSELAAFLPGAVAASLLPGLLAARAGGEREYRAAFQRFFDLNAALAYVIALPLVLLAPWLVRWAYGAHYAAAAPVLAVLGGTFMWAAIGVARGQYCVNEGHTRFHFAATTAGALLNIALNAWLIPAHGGLGAAWATFIAQGVAAWVSSFAFTPVRVCAGMQTRALLLPFRFRRYVFRAS